jgi:hypothetical protein
MSVIKVRAIILYLLPSLKESASFSQHKTQSAAKADVYIYRKDGVSPFNSSPRKILHSPLVGVLN